MADLAPGPAVEPVCTAAELAALLTERLRPRLVPIAGAERGLPMPRAREVLACGPGVAAALAAQAPEPAPGPWPAAGDDPLAAMTGIDLVTAGSAPPGWWRLTRHDRCQVAAARHEVSHEACTVVAEGKIAAP